MSTLRSEENSALPAYRRVIKECIRRDYECTFPGPTLDAVLNEWFPLGKGGVSHAHRKLHAEIRQDIAAFYDRQDWPQEPTHGREFA